MDGGQLETQYKMKFINIIIEQNYFETTGSFIREKDLLQ